MKKPQWKYIGKTARVFNKLEIRQHLKGDSEDRLDTEGLKGVEERDVKGVKKVKELKKVKQVGVPRESFSLSISLDSILMI